MLWCCNFLKTLCSFGAKRTKTKEDNGRKSGEKSDCCLLPTQKRGRFLLGSFGALFVALSSAIYFLDPVEIITKTTLQISDGSFAYRLWKKPPVPVTVKIYIFNVTNADAFLRGEENLKVDQLGPYVFSEQLENHNVTFNKNNTITYIPRRTVWAEPGKTVGDPKNDVVTVINAPYLGAVSYLADRSILTNMAFNTFTTVMEAKPFLTMTVEDFLWGYEDKLIRLAHTILPDMFNFEKFGYMDRIFDEGDNIITMNLNTEPEVGGDGQQIRPLSIDHFNGEPGLEHYGYEKDDPSTHLTCNTLQGVAGDGILFPRHMKKNVTYLVYRKVFCRTMPIVFDHTGTTHQGLPGYWFKFPDDAFDNTNPDNTCFCREDEGPCFPNGFSEITSCYWNMPAAVSFPHFLNVNSSLFKTVEGLSPNEEDHGSSIVIQENIGVMMQAHSRIQVNLIMGDVKYNLKVKPFSNMVLPIMWTDFSFDELPQDILVLIHLLVIVAPIVQNILIILFGVVGVALLTSSLVRFDERTKDTPIWIGRYNEVKIIPIVRHDNRSDVKTMESFLS